MDSYQQLASAPPMGQQTSFSYYNSDSKCDLSQHRYPPHPRDISMPVYSSHTSQTVSPAHQMYPQSDVSNSSAPYSQMFHSGFATTRTHGDHTSQSDFSKTSLIGHNIPTNMMVEPKISESDMYYYPTTPPLSASASVIGSPPEFNGISTPINPAYFGVNQVKDDPLSESVSHAEWVRCGSPPVTPVFIQPSSLISNGGANDGITGQCSLMSPSPSPYPNSVSSEPDIDFCDPRNLTVLPNTHPTVIPIKSNINSIQGSLPILLHNDEDDQRILLNRDASMRQIVDNNLLGFQVAPQVGLSDINNNNSDAVMEEDFVNEFVNFSVPEFTHYYGSKRQRTDSGSDLTSIHSEAFISADEFEESECVDQLATAYPLSPPSSGSEPYFTYTGDVIKKERYTRKSKRPSIMSNGISSMASCSKADGTESTTDHGSEGSHTTAPSHSGVPDMDQANDINSGAAHAHVPVTRRGRKQSLTEDPSKIFVCDLCNRRFRRQEHLKRHYRSLHTQDKPFECQECGKKFSRSDNLSQHSRTHGSGANVIGLLEDGELPGDIDADGEHIQTLGSVLYRVAAATSGSETDNSSKDAEICDDTQSRKKRKRSD